MYIVAVYIVWVPTVIPLELNKLSPFGTKMVTLFGRWNKRLLLAKVLVGTNRYGAVNFLNYKQFCRLRCPPFSFIWFPPLLCNMSVVFACIRVLTTVCFGQFGPNPCGKFHPPTARRSSYFGHV